MTKYLITGAGGFIGSYLVEYLIKDGIKPENLRLLVTSNKSLDKLPNESFDVVIGDIRNKVDVKKAVKGVQVIYHLAAKHGQVGMTENSYDNLKDTNVTGTKYLVESAIEAGVKRFIFFSSTAVYGLPAKSGDVTNFDETHQRNFSEPYGRTKYEAEKILINLCEKSEMKYLIIRPTSVFGLGDHSGIRPMIKVLKGGYFFFIGNGENKLDYIYIKDLIRIVSNLEKSKIANEDFIVGSGMPLSQKDIINIIAQELGVKTPRIFFPKKLALFLSYLVSYFSMLMGIKPILSPERIRGLSSNFYFNTAKLKKCGYKSEYSFKQGIKEEILYINGQEKNAKKFL